MRPADPADLAAIAELLAPLEAEGILAPRSRAQLEADLPHFVVAEREAKVVTTVFAHVNIGTWHAHAPCSCAAPSLPRLILAESRPGLAARTLCACICIAPRASLPPARTQLEAGPSHLVVAERKALRAALAPLVMSLCPACARPMVQPAHLLWPSASTTQAFS